MSDADRDTAGERVNLLLELRRFTDAEGFIREALARDPEWGHGYVHLARALNALGRYPEAEVAARTGVGKSPADPWALATLGFVLGSGGDAASGLAAADAAIQAAVTYAWAYFIRSQLLGHLGRWQESLAAAEAGLVHEPSNAELVASKGAAELHLGNIAAAVQTAKSGLEAHPTSAIMVNLRGITLFASAGEQGLIRRLGARRAAEKVFRDAVRIDPANEDSRNNLLLAAASVRRPVVVAAIVVASCVPFGLASWLVWSDRQVCCGWVPLGVSVWAFVTNVIVASRSPPVVLTTPLVGLGSRAVGLRPEDLSAGRRGWKHIVLRWLAALLAVVSGRLFGGA